MLRQFLFCDVDVPAIEEDEKQKVCKLFKGEIERVEVCRPRHYRITPADLEKLLKKRHKLSPETVATLKQMIAAAHNNEDDFVLIMDGSSDDGYG